MSQKEYARHQRVAPQLQREIMLIIREELSDSSLNLTTVTEIRMSTDLKSAKVFVSCMGMDPKPAVELLNESAGRIRGFIGRRIRLRYVPQLKFVADELPDQAAHLDEERDFDQRYRQERYKQPHFFSPSSWGVSRRPRWTRPFLAPT